MELDSPGKQELDTSLVLNADLAVCDLIRQSSDHGEFQHAKVSGKLSNEVELGQDHSGRPSQAVNTIADLTGIAPQDIAITSAVLNVIMLKSQS